MNDAYFLPEDRPSVELAAVASPDRETIARILELEPWPEPRPPAAPLRSATRAEIDEHWHGAPATDELYRGRLEVVAGGEPFAVGEQRGIVVRVENHGSHVWPQGGVGWPSVAVAYRWLDDTGETVVAEGLRTRLPATLRARRLAARCRSTCSRRPSRVRTCSSSTCCTSTRAGSAASFGCRSTSVPALSVALLGEDDESARLAAAALAELAPDVRPLVLTASPDETSELHGYGAALDARGYVLGRRRKGVRGTAGALGRAGALLGDAALRRVGRQPRLASAGGSVYLEGLMDADALLVAGDATLRGERGEREALQQLSAVLAASTLGLSVVVVSTAEGGAGGRLAGQALRHRPRSASPASPRRSARRSTALRERSA